MKLTKNETTELLNKGWLKKIVGDDTYVLLYDRKERTTEFVVAGHSPIYNFTLNLDIDALVEYDFNHLNTILADLRHEIEKGGINTQDKVKSALNELL